MRGLCVLSKRLLKKLGVPNADAQIGADALVAADLRGVDTHGVIRFSPQAWYVKWLSEGSMTARPNIRIISESASTALIDGDRGMGMMYTVSEPARFASNICGPAVTKLTLPPTSACTAWLVGIWVRSMLTPFFLKKFLLLFPDSIIKVSDNVGNEIF